MPVDSWIIQWEAFYHRQPPDPNLNEAFINPNKPFINAPYDPYYKVKVSFKWHLVVFKCRIMCELISNMKTFSKELVTTLINW